jgi:hypothetical protein
MRRPSNGFYVSLAIGLCGLAAALYMLVAAGFHEALKREGWHLLALRNAWLLNGAPRDPDPGAYATRGDPGYRTWRYTNALIVNGVYQQPLFATTCAAFQGRGFLVVTTNGLVIWVELEKGPRVISLGHETKRKADGTSP